MSNLVLYLIGFAVLTIGLAWGAHALGVSAMWIGIGVVIMIGIGIITGVSRTRLRESSPDDNTRRVVIDEE